MAQFVSIHRAPGLSPDEMAENALPVFNHGTATYIQNYVIIHSLKNSWVIGYYFPRVWRKIKIMNGV